MNGRYQATGQFHLVICGVVVGKIVGVPLEYPMTAGRLKFDCEIADGKMGMLKTGKNEPICVMDNHTRLSFVGRILDVVPDETTALTSLVIDVNSEIAGAAA